MIFVILQKLNYSTMIVFFEKKYLKDLYENMTTDDKKYRFQPQIIRKYIRVIDLMIAQKNVMGLALYGALHYEHLHGDKEGLSSLRINNQYRIEFREQIQDGETIASICCITELSNLINKVL